MGRRQLELEVDRERGTLTGGERVCLVGGVSSGEWVGLEKYPAGDGVGVFPREESGEGSLPAQLARQVSSSMHPLSGDTDIAT